MLRITILKAISGLFFLHLRLSHLFQLYLHLIVADASLFVLLVLLRVGIAIYQPELDTLAGMGITSAHDCRKTQLFLFQRTDAQVFFFLFHVDS